MNVITSPHPTPHNNVASYMWGSANERYYPTPSHPTPHNNVASYMLGSANERYYPAPPHPTPHNNVASYMWGSANERYYPTPPHPVNPMNDIKRCKTLVRFSTRRHKHIQTMSMPILACKQHFEGMREMKLSIWHWGWGQKPEAPSTIP